MKKLFSILSLLLLAGLYAQTPTLPITKLNNVSITNPVQGTKNDSVLVWRGSGDKVVRWVRASDIGGTTPTLQAVVNTGSVGIITDDGSGSPKQFAAAVYNAELTQGGSVVTSKLNSSLTVIGANGTSSHSVSDFGHAFTVRNATRLDLAYNGTFFRDFVALYADESTLRPLMTSDNQIPSIGRVKKIIIESDIKNKPYYYPSWWTGLRIPISVKNGQAQYDYDVSSKIDLSTYTPYYLSPSGNDINDGLTKLTPKKTVTSAVTAGAKLIYMMPGLYLRNTFYGAAYNPGGDLVIIGIGDVSVTNSEDAALTWTLTTNNTYSTTRSTVTNVLDIKYKNKYGYYSNLKQVTSQALCEAESGTYYTDNATLWVHASDNRTPDTNIKPQLYINSYISTDANKFYLENIDFYDFEIRCDGITSSSTLDIYMKNVNVSLSRKSRVGLTNEYNSVRLEGFRNTVLQNCTGLETSQDIFNYHNVLGVANSSILELECKGYSAGLTSVSSSNQCSSIHENLTILRVNGNYFGGNNQVIADVGATQSILIGCELNTESGQPNSVIFSGVNAELFGCRLFGNKIIKEEGGTNAVTVYNSVVDYSTTIGNVVIN